jgi:hypothetical protein
MARRKQAAARAGAAEKAPTDGQQTTMSSSDVVRFLEEERSRHSRRQQLIRELLTEREQRIRELDDQLRLLGYTEGQTGTAAPRRRRGGARIRRIGEKPCAICGFRTKPPHDARWHRGQQTKQPFSAKDLRDRGMERVA